MRRLLCVLCLVGVGLIRAETVESLQSGDEISLIFSIKEDALDGIYAVAKDGALSLPFVGKITVAGLTPAQTCEVIRRKYLEDGIYTRLAVALIDPPQRYISIPNSGGGYIRQPVPSGGKSPGDFYTPQEKKRLFRLPQLDVRGGPALSQ